MDKEFRLVSSLEKIFFDIPPNLTELNSGSMLKNEIYSFQLACFVMDGGKTMLPCTIEIKSKLEKYITVYQIGYVPSQVPAYTFTKDKNFISKQPGLYPDTMNKIYNKKFEFVNGQACALWFSVEPNGEMCGNYPIEIEILSEDEKLLAKKVFNINIIDKELPRQKLINTCWFHGDCIAKLHNVEINSSEYFEIVEKYLSIYTKFGHNMILTPIFTPPLDTDVGSERPTNQLVNVFLHNGEYSFNFEKLGYWIKLCKKYGIRYYEISHLFTQWGAKYTPKIIAETDEGVKRIFGWDVEAVSDEYKKFIDSFMPQLISFLKQEKVFDNCFFHVSDEPTKEHVEQYRAARELILPYIPENQLMDALSDYVFYETGLIKKPVVCNDHIKAFMDNNVKNLWTYYCCCQYDGVSNRFMAMPSARNRILGYQLYKYDIEGFLQWGFNFWFTQRSREVINPYAVTDAGGAFPSGDSFIVYPQNKYGDAVTSLRLYVFNEGLQDLRALQLLESIKGAEYTKGLLDEIVGFDKYPSEAEYILKLREKINSEIEKAV